MDQHPVDWAFDKLKLITRVVLLVIASFWLFDGLSELNRPPKPIKYHWKNEDPGKKVTDIQYLNYDTGEVIYREYGPPTSNSKYIGDKVTSTKITTSSRIYEIDLTPEEILEQLNLEYEDVRDYYGSELM